MRLGSLPVSNLIRDLVGAFIYRLHLSIDHALAVSYRRDQYGENISFVARITLVKGVPFYGYHVGYRFFLKIYMYNPIVMTRLADLLQQGVILKRKFQPYEAHLQYIPQFMIDYNLYGCDYLDSSKIMFRSPVPDQGHQSGSSHLWHSQSIPLDNVTDDAALPRVSHCSVEVDIRVQDIVNRTLVQERKLHHDFVELTNPLPADMKLVHSMAGLWRDETVRRKRAMPRTKQQDSPFPPEALVSMSAEPRAALSQNWIHETEYREQIAALATEEAEKSESKELDFATYVPSVPYEQTVKTVLQSVDDLFPDTLLPVLGISSREAHQKLDPASSIEVDEAKARETRGVVDSFFPEDSDEEALMELAANGTASDLAKAGELPVRPWQTYVGVCRSGFQTSKCPEIPISQSMMDLAETVGHISRARKPVSTSHRDKLKRSLSGALSESMESRKRQQPVNVKSPVQASAVSCASSQAIKHEPEAGPTSSSITPSSQQLNFPVVKDQNDPYTKLRLSQKSKPTSSQIADDERPVKLPLSVSFGSIAEKASISDPNATRSSATQTAAPPATNALAIQKAIARSTSSTTYVLAALPPSLQDVLSYNPQESPNVAYQDAFYSKELDVPPRAREYAGREFRLESNTVPFLPDFFPPESCTATPDNFLLMERQYRERKRSCKLRSWEFASVPPSFGEVALWAQKRLKPPSPSQATSTQPARRQMSQIEGPTPRNKHGFKYSQKQKSTSVQHEVQYMSTMSLEIHVNTRGKLVPNPEEDEIQCVFWSCKGDDALQTSQCSDGIASGVIVLSSDGIVPRQIQRTIPAEVVQEDSELDLLVRLTDIVRSLDPDILTGYEVHGGSWGYLMERARLKYEYNLCDELSRMKAQSHGRFGKQSDSWGFNTTSTIRVTGRHMINIWRAMRGELNLLQYTMENVVWHLLHKRLPHFSFKTLTNWYRSGKPHDLGKLIRYLHNRARLDLEILESNELIARTSEQARLLGVDFFSVFSRGSQFKVESIMFRIAKPENFILVSPSKKQVGGQNALECLPLVMEPQSAFYSSPLLVLDFQSLYPSVMIAYNYCYSTFLGRISNWRGASKMGFTDYKRQEGLLHLLKDYINIAPNGMMYVKAEIRKSLLAKMLTEILETRVMVKTGMKKDKDDKTLQQLLNNRQLALKLLANVTYGYTSASFSGRMPCSEIADSIVQTGRETLERTISFIHSVEKWGAEVVYGDTDSLFIYLKGRTRDQAFDIGNEIANTITDMNPRPVKLKFEKVYHPCVLLAKKRYVGYMYETKDQVKPDFDAKGIETVRRDGTPAEQKIEEKVLRMLFETADLSKIKEYFQQQCDKIMRGSVSVQDFCFAKEVRLGSYSDKGPPPAGALISTKRMLEDARAEPQYGERVPYVVISGAPGARLIDRCVAPEDLLANPHWQLDSEYYISKNIIPPLERIFNLMGANVRQWYDDMPKVQRMHQTAGMGSRRFTLESYMRSTHCIVCSVKFTADATSHCSTATSLCPDCHGSTPSSLVALQTRLAAEERKFEDMLSVCRSCIGEAPLDDVRCDSKDCPVFWSRMKQKNKVIGVRTTNEPVIKGLLDNVRKEDLEW